MPAACWGSIRPAARQSYESKGNKLWIIPTRKCILKLWSFGCGFVCFYIRFWAVFRQFHPFNLQSGVKSGVSHIGRTAENKRLKPMLIIPQTTVNFNAFCKNIAYRAFLLCTPFSLLEHCLPIVENWVLYNITTGGDFMPFK